MTEGSGRPETVFDSKRERTRRGLTRKRACCGLYMNKQIERWGLCVFASHTSNRFSPNALYLCIGLEFESAP
jgi:hypothetical protein